MPEIIIITLVLLFFAVNISFIFLLKVIPENNCTSQIKYLDFSIVIAAKNETENISSLIDALHNIKYPEENFETIIIDDDSTDNTYKIAEELIKNKCNFHLYQVEEKEFPAKKGALSFGIKTAKNPFVLITDADCVPEEEWLNSYAEKFKEGYDFIFGNAPLIQSSSFVNKISCFENLRSSILTFSAANAGIPYSASARNFGFKKSSFEKIKGYSNTTQTLSGDDDLLLREAIKYNLKIGTVLNKGSFVYSSTKNSLKEYFNQRARHTKTSLYYLPGRQFFLSLWHLINLFFLFSPLLMFFNNLFGLLFLIKLLTDFIIVESQQKKFSYNFNLLEIFWLQIFYEIFLIIHFVNALFKKDKWK